MKNKIIVLALGGNALGDTPQEQEEAVKETAKSIVDLVQQGHKVIVGHGNGPQVGMISLAFDNAKKNDEKFPSLSLALAGSMSQGYIGLHLRNSINNELLKRNLPNRSIALISQSIVSKEDPAFSNFTKPIGRFYSKEESHQLIKENNWQMIEDSGRGYRRIVPSPEPISIMEADFINQNLNSNNILIVGGGGGIATYIEDGQYKIVDAVIDKDFTAEKIAEQINADLFIIVTAVDGIYLNYGSPDQKLLLSPSTFELQKLIDQGLFPKGSMEPKVKAAVKFVNFGKNKEAIITSLNNLNKSISEDFGTHIKN